MAVGVVTAFPGTPLGTIRESSSSWGSPKSTENVDSLPGCKGDKQTALIGHHARATDIPFQQGEHRADGAFRLLTERQADHAVKGQRAEHAFEADSERQSPHKIEGQRVEGAFQAESNRQAGHEVEGKEVEAAGSLQSSCDSISEVAEMLDCKRHASSSAASVISEVMPEANGAVQAVSSADASGELFQSTPSCQTPPPPTHPSKPHTCPSRLPNTLLPPACRHAQTDWSRAWSSKHHA